MYACSISIFFCIALSYLNLWPGRGEVGIFCFVNSLETHLNFEIGDFSVGIINISLTILVVFESKGFKRNLNSLF